MTVRKTVRKIAIGTTFTAPLADSRSIFTVIEARGGDTYQCEVKADPIYGPNIDWFGHRKVYGGEEIRAELSQERMWATLRKSANEFWASRKVSEIVHYHNGFGQYVRGEIVRVDDQNKMMPIALVGNWSKHDLPRRQSDGSVFYSYHVKKIRFPGEDSSFQPNDSNVWESKNFSKPMGPNRDFDPVTAKPIDLSDPAPLEGDVAETARYEALRMKLTTVLSEGFYDPKAALIETAKLIAQLGIKV